MKKIYFKFLWLIVFALCGYTGIAQSNQYLHFDGVDDYTSLPNGAQYVNGSNTITMAGWFKTDELIYGQGMMSIRGGGTGDGEMYIIQLSDGKLECRIVTSTGLKEVVGPVGTIQAGEWQHLAWVFNETYVELFVDGVSIGTGPASGTFQSATKPFTIGKSVLSGFNFIYKGGADEVSLWSKALTAAEIQDMMENELTGNEDNLEVYYKFNQGTPQGNNTSISQLLAESGDANRNADLLNFALTGNSSNFLGELEDNFQSINFLPVANKLITDNPFQLTATVNSGLPITFEVVSGPASVEGDMVTLEGTVGEVTIKASQSGNDDFEPADDVFVTFQVLDPAAVLVETEVLHPLAGDVYASSLMPIKVAVRAGIDYPELFSIEEVQVDIDGDNVNLENHGNGYFTGWWTPSSYGNHNLIVTSSNNFSAENEENVSFNLQQNASNISVDATDEVWVNSDFPTKTVESDLPSHIGAYDQITGTLFIDCPNGGCDPWDRISSIEAQGKNGDWYEIIKYMTPYGVSCQSEIDLTDFASILQGKTKFRVNLGTQGNGFLYTLQLNYNAGVPEYPYSTLEKLWNDTYPFGDLADLQPTENLNMLYPEGTQTAKIKLISTGHGWSGNEPEYDSNTNNAAEFSENTHHIWVDGQQTFTQHNWNDCNPNPDGCQPQAGTWTHSRAGWCPGSIAQFFDYNMGDVSSAQSVELEYVFDESYVDYCHPNNPDCITGVTCSDCDDGFNPHLIVTSYLISFGQSPLNTLAVEANKNQERFNLYPNPASEDFYVEIPKSIDADLIVIHDNLGRMVKTVKVNSFEKATHIQLGNQSNGIYLVSIQKGNDVLQTKRLVIE